MENYSRGAAKSLSALSTVSTVRWVDPWYRPRYHGNVANAAKILSRMRNNPRDWRIEDLKVLASKYSIQHRQHGTSHVVFIHISAGMLSVPCARPIKPVYIRRFVAMIDKLEGAE